MLDRSRNDATRNLETVARAVAVFRPNPTRLLMLTENFSLFEHEIIILSE